MSAGLLLLAVAGVLAWGIARSGAPSGQQPSRLAELEAPVGYELPSLGGERLRLADYAGRVVLVDFWATWCTPCYLQADILETLHASLREDEVQFLAISLGEPLEVVEDFVRRNPFPYPVLVDSREVLGQALDIYALPTVMVLDREGRISFLRPGVTDERTLRQALDEAGAAESRLSARGSASSPT